MQKPTRIVLLVIILALGLTGLWWWREQAVSVVPSQPSQSSTTSESTPSQSASPAAKIASYTLTATTSSTNALALAQSELDLQLKQYDFGAMIEGVNGLLADATSYWAVYLNGDYAQVGIADLVLEQGDTVELRYEAIAL